NPLRMTMFVKHSGHVPSPLSSHSKRLVVICFQPFRQTGQRKGKQFLDLRTTQRSVGGPRGALIFFPRTGFDSGIQLRPARGNELANLPAREPFTPGDMVNTWLIFCDKLPDRSGGDFGRNGTTKFIGEKFERFAGLPRAAQLFVETALTSGRDATVQRSADNRVLGVAQHDLFSGNFRLGVNTQRIHRIGFHVVALPSVKDKVGGKEDQWNPGSQLDQMPGDFDVEFVSKSGVGLANGAFAERSAMNQELRSLPVKGGVDSAEIGQLELGAC